MDKSPDYCNQDKQLEIQGTVGRECFSKTECDKLCCGRGIRTLNETRNESCKCKFKWCCDVKCETCIRKVKRFFCN